MRIFQPHVDLPEAYTFPLVTAIIDAGPLPRDLAEIPKPFQNSLVATLALELASVTVPIVARGQPSAWDYDTEQRLLRRFGGPSYLALLRDQATVARGQQDVRDEQRQLVRLVNGFADNVLEKLPGTRFGPGPYGDILRWRYDFFPPDRTDELDHLRGKIRRTLRRESDLQLRAHRVAARLEQARNAIRGQAEFRAALKNEPWRQPTANFGMEPEMQSAGAAHFLRNNDFNWWRDFVERFQDAVKPDSNLRLALRSPRIIHAIDERMAPKWNTAAADYLNAHPTEWGADLAWRIQARHVNGARQFMRAQDREGMRWLAQRKRNFNFYTVWLANKCADLERDNAKARAGLKLNLNWLTERAKEFPTGPRENVDWRMNELSWVLSRRQPDVYRFVPLTSLQFGRAEWEAHLKRWWAAIERAQVG